VITIKGRNTFTKKEVDDIRKLLKLKNTSARAKQVVYRSKLREMGFYITDFDQTQSGFTTYHLDDLIRKGIIRIKNNT
jgi:hypothetical protein